MKMNILKVLLPLTNDTMKYVFQCDINIRLISLILLIELHVLF